ncbi:SDR family NAD(P)-dependent oxidoreductase [Pseudobdellovibrio sp. HCB154]|uniref:SDR family NAD(P)-dependent oxidoreductase n=1 Tax=Pseudobdellovibrio sp. HCB154 TaxID=3386277 RepID=UPI00391749A3
MNEDRSAHKFILLGASRGLGWATYEALAKKYPAAEFLLVSRKIGEGNFKSLKCDFSKELSSEFITTITDFNPTTIIYFAAGGPYGNFQDKKWADHQWALQVSFLFPAQLVHHLMRISVPSLKKFVVVGSAIAENKPDPGAASYCAAKHALKGLISTLQAENKSAFKIDLFSPGYIATDMLPVQSWPRQQGLADTAENVANQLIDSLN